MQEKESVIVVQFELKIQSLGLTVRHHSASQTVTLMTEFSIHTSQPLKILIDWLMAHRFTDLQIIF